MGLRNILHDGDPILTKKSREVTDFNKRLHDLLDDLGDTMMEAGGLGLAAPQVGVLRRVAVILDEFAVEDSDEVDYEIIEMVNPRIIEQDGELESLEGCLSFPGLHGKIMRPQTVTVEAQDRLGNTFTLDAHDILARAACHEIDHLDGVTISQRAEKLYTEKQIEEKEHELNEQDKGDE